MESFQHKHCRPITGPGIIAAALIALLLSTPLAADGDSVFIFDAPADGATVEKSSAKDEQEKPAAKEADAADDGQSEKASKDRKRKTPTKKQPL